MAGTRDFLICISVKINRLKPPRSSDGLPTRVVLSDYKGAPLSLLGYSDIYVALCPGRLQFQNELILLQGGGNSMSYGLVRRPVASSGRCWMEELEEV